jgi:hypothetical protein
LLSSKVKSQWTTVVYAASDSAVFIVRLQGVMRSFKKANKSRRKVLKLESPEDQLWLPRSVPLSARTTAPAQAHFKVN